MQLVCKWYLVQKSPLSNRKRAILTIFTTYPFNSISKPKLACDYYTVNRQIWASIKCLSFNRHTSKTCKEINQEALLEQVLFRQGAPIWASHYPMHFNELSDAIEWILLDECSISFVCHILDDFLIVEPPCPTPPLDSLCRASLSSMILTFKTLNIPISASKTEGPCQIIEFMGTILDSGKMEARLPEDKVERIKSAISNFQSRRSTTERYIKTPPSVLAQVPQQLVSLL